ncbi:hypothetical protein HPB52_011172 [Rhipicephalus sanguineus]|uniref:Uncharacterized protein n=1 Tax=Rhipicephalus sanguineus TaxID=34632 RepID=A0A9D4Q216_RHISA|nr:hypothetical protein HPB52_011172 [Rhipicephalus sanguineus]
MRRRRTTPVAPRPSCCGIGYFEAPPPEAADYRKAGPQGCVLAATRLHANGRVPSPACRRRGNPETLEHLVCARPDLVKECLKLNTLYRQQSLPAGTFSDLLSARLQVQAFISLVVFVETTDRQPP